MYINQKHTFWEALVITIFIFGLGILLGLFIENSRQDRISEAYLNSEIDLLDIKIQTEILNLEDLNCPEAVEKNIEFADRVYEDAKTLKSYEDASRMSDTLVQQHKRYDLLRTLLWINSIRIKEKCKQNPFHTIVYLYDHDPQEIEKRSKQEIFSRFLSELKEEYGNKVILIPIAKNLNLASLEIMIKDFNIGQIAVIVDEKIVIDEIEDLYQVRFYLK